MCCCQLLFLFSPRKSALFCFDVWIVSECFWLPSAISFCINICFPFIHSLMPHHLVRVCTWLFRKQMQSDSAWQGPPSWASEPRGSPVSTCATCPSPLLLSFSFPWSIHHQLHAVVIRWHQTCAGTSAGERDRKIRELAVVWDTSAQAKQLQLPSSLSSSLSSPLSASPHALISPKL